MRVLVTGATGYIGGRLVPRLLNAGHEVRVFVRDVDRLADRPWSDWVDQVEGDIFDRDALDRALDGMEAAYYLIHSMCSTPDFAERDRRAATAFAEAGQHLKRVVYLGGILPERSTVENSEHLRSRAEVGDILRGRLPTVEFRAGPIIGSGSASFEMVRYLTERLPIMTPPRWILNEVQPIGVRNVLEYLVAVLGRDDAEGVVEIGGEVMTFRDMMLRYAKVRGLPRIIIPMPLLLPSLAARWVGLVTPIENCLALPLVKGMIRPVVADLTRAGELFPDIRPMGYEEAVELALVRVQQERVATRFSDAVGDDTFHFEDREGLLREVRTRVVDASPQAVYRAFTSLGGEQGWLTWDWAWRLRGFLDQLVGGPGLRRGRRDPHELRPGDAVDFWRVEEIHPGRLMRLRAEMRVPGRAWLQYEAEPEDDGRTRLVQAALFAPRGFWGWAYWAAVFPAHFFIFDAMIDSVAELALRYEGESPRPLPERTALRRRTAPGS